MTKPIPFLQSLEDLERLATGSKLSRLLHHPFKYLLAQFYSKLLPQRLDSGLKVTARTFWGEPFQVHLPAGTDIYLTGGKSHDSELRLVRYLAAVLKPGGVVLDIGSHFGYFALLALRCVGDQGRVLALEPSQKTFEVLQANLGGFANATLLNLLAGAEDGQKTFCEFGGRHSEYSTVYPDQFTGQRWYKTSKRHSYSVPCRSVDSLVAGHGLTPSFIKIDTEGFELEVLQGAQRTLRQHRDTTVAMEYLCPGRGNQGHVKAVRLMQSLGYAPYVITRLGTLRECRDLDQHLRAYHLECDNIVFRSCP
jgi:FkbM family methyltransferase